MGSAAVRVEETAVPMPDGVRLSADVVTVDDGRPPAHAPHPHALLESRVARGRGSGRPRPARLVGSDPRRPRTLRLGGPLRSVPPRRRRRRGDHRVVRRATVVRRPRRRVGRQLPRRDAMAARRRSDRAALAGDRADGHVGLASTTGWTYEGGALQLGFVMPWAVMMAASDPTADADDRLTVAAELAATMRRALPPPRSASTRCASSSAAFAEWLAADPARHWRPVDVAKTVPSSMRRPGLPRGRLVRRVLRRNIAHLRAAGRSRASRNAPRYVAAARRRSVDPRRPVPGHDARDGVRRRVRARCRRARRSACVGCGAPVDGDDVRGRRARCS